MIQSRVSKLRSKFKHRAINYDKPRLPLDAKLFKSMIFFSLLTSTPSLFKSTSLLCLFSFVFASDCDVIADWILNFNASRGTACCNSQNLIVCDAVTQRITEMYFARSKLETLETQESKVRFQTHWLNSPSCRFLIFPKTRLPKEFQIH